MLPQIPQASRLFRTKLEKSSASDLCKLFLLTSTAVMTHWFWRGNFWTPDCLIGKPFRPRYSHNLDTNVDYLNQLISKFSSSGIILTDPQRSTLQLNHEDLRIIILDDVLVGGNLDRFNQITTDNSVQWMRGGY